MMSLFKMLLVGDDHLGNCKHAVRTEDSFESKPLRRTESCQVERCDLNTGSTDARLKNAPVARQVQEEIQVCTTILSPSTTKDKEL
jgi:BRCT domain type II-containing protein